MAASLTIVDETGGQVVDLFSYAAMTRDDEVFVRQEAAAIKQRLQRTAEDVIEIGLALKRVKDRLPHGAFLPWLMVEFEMSESAAQRFMGVARYADGKSRTVRDLKPTALYALATAEPEVQAAIEEKLAAGDIVTAQDVKALKAENKRVKGEVRGLEGKVDKLKKEKTKLLASAHKDALDKLSDQYKADKESDAAEIQRLRSRLDGIGVATAQPTSTPSNSSVLKFPVERTTPPLEMTEEEKIDAVDLTDPHNRSLGTFGSAGSISRYNIDPETFWKSMEGSPSMISEATENVNAAIKILTAIQKGNPNV